MKLSKSQKEFGYISKFIIIAPAQPAALCIRVCGSVSGDLEFVQSKSAITDVPTSKSRNNLLLVFFGSGLLSVLVMPLPIHIFLSVGRDRATPVTILWSDSIMCPSSVLVYLVLTLADREVCLPSSSRFPYPACYSLSCKDCWLAKISRSFVKERVIAVIPLAYDWHETRLNINLTDVQNS